MRRGIRYPSILAATLLLVCAGLLAPVLAAAQAATASPPAVSRLRVSTDKYSVALTWTDAPDGAASYAVYRSATAFTETGLSKAERIAGVAAGKGSYTDEPPSGTKWFYAVLALDPAGKPFEVFTKMGTMTGAAVSVESRPAAAPPPAVAAAAATEPAPLSPGPPQPAIAETKPAAAATGTEVPAEAKAALPATAPAAQEVPPKAEALATTAATPAASAPVAPAATAATAEGAQKKAQPALPLAMAREEPLDEGVLAMSDSGTGKGQPAITPPVLLVPPREAPLPFYLYGSTAARPSLSVKEGAAGATSPALTKAIVSLVDEPGRPYAPEMPALSLPGLAEDDPPRDELDRIMLDTADSGDWKMARAFLSSYIEILPAGGDPELLLRARLYLGIALARIGLFNEALYELVKTSDSRYARESQAWTRYAIDASRARDGAPGEGQTLTE